MSWHSDTFLLWTFQHIKLQFLMLNSSEESIYPLALAYSSTTGSPLHPVNKDQTLHLSADKLSTVFLDILIATAAEGSHNFLCISNKFSNIKALMTHSVPIKDIISIIARTCHSLIKLSKGIETVWVNMVLLEILKNLKCLYLD